MILYITFISSGVVLLAGAFYLLFKFDKKEINKQEEPSEEYLFAKEIFVRDPEDFKDKDKDGVDDIIDKNV